MTENAPRSAESERLDDLRLRLMKATTTVDALALAATNPHEKRRLEGKSEGLRVALSYVQEMLAEVSRLDGSGVSREDAVDLQDNIADGHALMGDHQ